MNRLLLFLIMGFGLAESARALQTDSLVWPRPPDRPRIRHVQTYSATSAFARPTGFFGKLTEWILGEEHREQWLVQPVGIAVRGDGMLAIADPGSHAVHLLDRQQNEHRVIAETDGDPFRSPVGVAFDREGWLYVTDSEQGRVCVFDEDGDPEFSFSDRLHRPTGIALTGDTIYVVDTGLHAVLLFDRKGRYLAQFGRRGEETGEFNFPTAVSCDASVWVLDAMNYRVQEFSSSGTALSMFGQRGSGIGALASPKSLARDTEGHVYVTDALMDNFQIFDRSGQLLLVVGRNGSANGEFLSPSGIAIDGEDRIVVVDALNRRIQVFQYLR
jgi:DNA-binding beta-propeller fold protein YncE